MSYMTRHNFSNRPLPSHIPSLFACKLVWHGSHGGTLRAIAACVREITRVLVLNTLKFGFMYTTLIMSAERSETNHYRYWCQPWEATIIGSSQTLVTLQISVSRAPCRCFFTKSRSNDKSRSDVFPKGVVIYFLHFPLRKQGQPNLTQILEGDDTFVDARRLF
ncbi:hypothetical protein DFP72DRAFT_284088 [Ephemerocybe angulata]|uniref:Uncharacterized protein n=1 Tax=Ephemerocybe angulata TaxID=980116 RepID=A0A8H6M9S7_9AGAR|nr:hypothetical protein DFP72DRAFT_284088 [Tulosesus angulatus]